MRSDAYIMVTCDGCDDVVEVQLVATARGGYDDRNVNGELEAQGWTVDGDRDLCEACTEDEANQQGE